MTLFLGYATEQLGKSPMAVQLMDITPELVLKFLAVGSRVIMFPFVAGRCFVRAS